MYTATDDVTITLTHLDVVVDVAAILTYFITMTTDSRKILMINLCVNFRMFLFFK